MLARVRASFDRQGMMSTLGVEVTSVEPGKVEMSLRHDDRFTQQHGFLHAGAVASVLDTACGYAAFSVMPPDAAVPDRELHHQPARARGREAVHDHRRGGAGGPHPGRLPRRGVRR
jgi:acyl-coenzyme A thioesterase PaaI-like protein